VRGARYLPGNPGRVCGNCVFRRFAH
jgi:hypothetical protein